MTSRNSTDVAKALRLLSRATHAAWNPAKIAAEVGVSVRSVYRWRNGENQPSARNREALKVLIQGLSHEANVGPYRMSATQQVLAQALDALTTTAERARTQQIADELKAGAEQAQADVEAALEARYQALRIARQRTPTTAQADVFAVIDSGRPAEVPMFGVVAA